jgi:hypothetical protein
MRCVAPIAFDGIIALLEVDDRPGQLNQIENVRTRFPSSLLFLGAKIPGTPARQLRTLSAENESRWKLPETRTILRTISWPH